MPHGLSLEIGVIGPALKRCQRIIPDTGRIEALVDLIAHLLLSNHFSLIIRVVLDFMRLNNVVASACLVHTVDILFLNYNIGSKFDDVHLIVIDSS